MNLVDINAGLTLMYDDLTPVNDYWYQGITCGNNERIINTIQIQTQEIRYTYMGRVPCRTGGVNHVMGECRIIDESKTSQTNYDECSAWCNESIACKAFDINDHCCRFSEFATDKVATVPDPVGTDCWNKKAIPCDATSQGGANIT
eukprot:UN29866